MNSDRYSFLNASHIKDIESLYKKYKINPNLVEPSWTAFFLGFDLAKEKNTTTHNSHYEKRLYISDIIEFFKKNGHLFSKNNPIFKNKLISIEKIKSYIDNKNNVINSILKYKISIREIIEILKKIYCRSIGIEYMYIIDYKKIKWIEKWIINYKKPFEKKEQKYFLKKLYNIVSLEKFIHLKFPGQKRFSIEGNESALLALDDSIKYAIKKYSSKCFIIGMSHRGRINVLSNILKKSYYKIFSEFQEKEYKEKYFSGDVKYHMGFSLNKKNIHIHLVPNPSHLESVNPVVEGIAKAQIDIFYSGNKNKVIPILFHGDASLSGQGIIYEVLQLSKLKGYKTGGTIHIVINNQIGFTTNTDEGRSSIYCTDIAKIVLSPVIHVNAEDIESVIQSIRFAIDFRMKYNEDIFIDIIGYRKYGHNESDEPRFTNPSLYDIIDNKTQNFYELYKHKLKKQNIINSDIIENIEIQTDNLLDKSYEKSKKIKIYELYQFSVNEKMWKPFPITSDNKNMFKNTCTNFPENKILEISNKIFTLPKKKSFIKKTHQIFKRRLNMINNNLVDWSMAELLSYGTLLDEGINIRLSGEDVARGTFSQRHIVVKTTNEEEIILLNTVSKDNNCITIYNSPLSEYSILGFEYGYSMVSPNTLNIWEAQFGDFSNGSQIIIDQYIFSGESKWKIRNGLVIMLPHGYEGQGPEHSSARIERYIQLCANNNVFLVNCTTPANFYHLIRRQIKRNFRKPLIIFTPKSLLRNQQCCSSIQEISKGKFNEILDDIYITKPDKVTKIVLCSGKIYYELINKRLNNKNKINQIAFIRIEQIYPLKIENIKMILKKYKNFKKVIWIQEEPKNMGIWNFITNKLKNITNIELISPPESSSPSTGSYKEFINIQNNILQKIFI